MKKTMKIMLAAMLAIAMLTVFASAAESDTLTKEDDVLMAEGIEVTADVAFEAHATENALASFKDAPAPDNWMYQGLNCAAANGIMTGHNNLIRPTDKLTRAEMTTMMVRVLGAEKLRANISGFVDVPASKWYYDAISSGVATKLINGSGNKMMPEAAITREQTMVILARAFVLTSNRNPSARFIDASSISSWAKDAVNALVDAEIVLGDSGNTIRPQANITRAEFATMLDRIVCRFADAKVSYAGKTIKGSLILGDANVDLSGATIEGDLIITEGAGNAKFDLTDVKVEGRIVVRSGEVTVLDADEDKIVTPAVEEVVTPTPVIPNKPVVPNDKEVPDVGSNPTSKDDGKFELEIGGTYVSWSKPGSTEEIEEIADINGNTIVFDLRALGAEANWEDIELKNVFVAANEKVKCEANGFSEVVFKTNEEYAVSELLTDMVDSTSKAVTKLMGMTDDAGNITKSFTLGSLSDMMETAYTFYTNDMSEDKWLQNLFDGREIVCDEAVNMASFAGTIGGKDYIILMIVPELQ